MGAKIIGLDWGAGSGINCREIAAIANWLKLVTPTIFYPAWLAQEITNGMLLVECRDKQRFKVLSVACETWRISGGGAVASPGQRSVNFIGTIFG